jgi:predicted nucleic acid-binding protein
MAFRTDGHRYIGHFCRHYWRTGQRRLPPGAAPVRLISAVTVLETQIVLLSRSGNGAISLLHQLIEQAGIQVVPFDGQMAEAAFDAFRRFGKGQGNKARLNYYRLRRLRTRQNAQRAPAVQRRRLRRNGYRVGASRAAIAAVSCRARAACEGRDELPIRNTF